jgi:hypothetical protein
MLYEDHELAPATVLRGHVSPKTAYEADGQRYWLRTPPEGVTAGQVCLMTQAADPAKPGGWKRPTGKPYSHWAVMYEDSLGHVDWWPIGKFGPNPWEHLRFRLRTLFDQLTPDERKGYVDAVKLGYGVQAEVWERANHAFELIADGAAADEVSALYEGHIHVSEQDHQIAVAANAAGLTLTV